ncbi:olfactory receptor 2D3-like [Discoglossus pictus]
MVWKNETTVTEFVFLGLSREPVTEMVLFVVFFTIYMISFIGNFLIIIVIMTNKKMHTPMYFFLMNLSFMDICGSSTTIPRTLKDLMSEKKIISYEECVAQMYISLSVGQSECILLVLMAYDRYTAICYPLHYTTVMSKSVCIKAAVGTWICGFLLPISSIALTLNIDLCGHNELNHFLCEVPEMLSLGCDNLMIVESLIFVVGIIILIIPVIYICVSYLKIIMTVVIISLSTGQHKSFSTCGSHVIVVTLFYGSAMATYMKPRSTSSSDIDKVISVFYVAIIPMLNPLIYTLRNNEVKAALRKLINTCYSNKT